MWQVGWGEIAGSAPWSYSIWTARAAVTSLVCHEWDAGVMGMGVVFWVGMEQGNRCRLKCRGALGGSVMRCEM